MTKQEVIKVLKNDFITKFGANNEVPLKTPICCIKDWRSGNGYIEKVRYNGSDFEYYLNFWNYGWKSDKTTFNKYVVAILSQCLDIKVKTRTEYFFD